MRFALRLLKRDSLFVSVRPTAWLTLATGRRYLAAHETKITRALERASCTVG
jgi:hypothetical protein